MMCKSSLLLFACLAWIGFGHEFQKNGFVGHQELFGSAKKSDLARSLKSTQAIAALLLKLNSAAGFKPSALQVPSALGQHSDRGHFGQRTQTVNALRHHAAVDMVAKDSEASPSLHAPSVSRRSLLLGAGVVGSLLTSSSAIAADADVYNPSPGSLTGTTIFITGANTGLGLESAKRLAKAGASIIVSARSKAKADAAAKQVAESPGAGKVVGIDLDLADLASVKSLPKRLEASLGGSPEIDVLLNNAGVMAVPERLTTADGFEKTVGINHLGHFALTAALLPFLRQAKNGFRIVTVSSDAHRLADKKSIEKSIDAKLDPAEYAVGGWGAYGVSKAANVLFTVELERRLKAAGLKGSAVTLHPGVVQTDLARYIVGGVKAEDTRLSETAEKPTGLGKFFKENLLDKAIIPVEKGAETQVYLAAAADAGGDRAQRGGLFFDKMKAVKATDAATDEELAKKLWALSEQLTGSKIDF